MMMQYYYLDSNRQPQGPHSREELMEMLLKGQITAATEIAAKGSDTWTPFGVLFSESMASQPSSPEASTPAADPAATASAGSCPKCHEEILLVEGNLPECCPACSKRLRPSDTGFWASVSSCLRQYCTWKGRATRSEFWWFYLFTIICTQVINILHRVVNEMISRTYTVETEQVNSFLTGLDNKLDSVAPANIDGMDYFWQTLSSALREYPLELFSGYHVSYAAAYMVFLLPSLLLFLPLLAVTVRRLHDTGASACSVILFYVGEIGIFAGLATWMWGIVDNILTAQEFSPEMFFNHGFTLMFISLGIAFISGIYLLVHFFLDSQRGPNKYGPSSKYPRG